MMVTMIILIESHQWCWRLWKQFHRKWSGISHHMVQWPWLVLLALNETTQVRSPITAA